MTIKTVTFISPSEGMMLTNGKRTCRTTVMTSVPEEVAMWREIPIVEEKDEDLPGADE